MTQHARSPATVVVQSLAKRLPWAIASATAVFGLVRAVSLAWVSDDAFISLRYAQQLVRGHGLVYNPGERVEGYTNFLWTMLLAVVTRIGADPVLWSKVLGLLCFGSLLAVLFVCSRRLGREAGCVPTWPVALVGFALMYHAAVFATGGLETMLFTLLVTGALCALGCARSVTGYAAAGMLFVLAMMTRPDGAVFYAVGTVYVLVACLRQGRWVRLWALLAPALLIYAPYFAWRFSYYGWLFPNTFYAKSAGPGNWSAGLRYVGLFFAMYYVLIGGALALVLVLSRSSLLRPRGPDARRMAALALGASCAYALFVLHVGGDFMVARLLVPVMPSLLLGLDLFVNHLGSAGARAWSTAAVAALAIFSWYPSTLNDLRGGIVEERSFYPESQLDAARDAGERLRPVLAGTDAQVVIYGSQAMLAYFAEFPVVIEGHTGLTDEYIAHLPLGERGRVGHEKAAPRDYLLRRGVNFMFAFGLVRFPPGDEFNRIEINGVPGRILVYDRELMERLKAVPGVRFTPVEAVLENYASGIERRSAEAVAADYARFRDYYFSHNADPERESVFTTRLKIRR